MTVLVDTYKAVEILKSSGMPKKQVDAVVDVFREFDEGIVTKTFLASELARLRADVVKELTVKLYGSQIAMFIALVALFKLL